MSWRSHGHSPKFQKCAVIRKSETAKRTSLIALAAICVTCAILLGCGGDDDDGGETPDLGGDVDLAMSAPQLKITYPPGAIQQGWPSTATTGDFNGDGVPDLLLGLPFADGPEGTRLDAGEAYVLFGPLSGEIDLSTPDAAGVIVIGAEVGDHLGGGVSAGDLNGDGIDDVIVGSPASNGLIDLRTDMGEAYVIFGREGFSGTFDTLDQVQDVTIQPAEGFSTLGLAFAVGDLNGDGIDDLVTGAPYAGRQANTPVGGPRTTVGEVYVFFGGDGFAGTLTVAEDQDDLRFAGVSQYDQFGGDVQLADFNGDGLLDLVVGASGYDGLDNLSGEAGAAFVFFGSEAPAERRVLTEADITISGPGSYSLGTLVAATDLDVDGNLEIGASAPGAPDATAPELGAGRFYMIKPPAAGNTVDVAVCDCVSIAYGALAGAFFPAMIASSPDGLRMALGAPREGASDRADSGVVYILEAGDTPDVLTSRRVLGATAREGLGSGLTFGDVDGDGRAELLALGVAPGDAAAATLYVLTLGD